MTHAVIMGTVTGGLLTNIGGVGNVKSFYRSLEVHFWKV